MLTHAISTPFMPFPLWRKVKEIRVSDFGNYWFTGNSMLALPFCRRPESSLHKKWIFPLRISSVNVTKSAVNWGMATFTEEIFNGKLHFLCAASCRFLKLIRWAPLPHILFIGCICCPKTDKT